MEDSAVARLAEKLARSYNGPEVVALAQLIHVGAHRRNGQRVEAYTYTRSGGRRGLRSHGRKGTASSGAGGQPASKSITTTAPAPPPKKTFPPLSKAEFSDPTTERTRGVSSAAFQDLAAQGEARLATFHDNASPPKGLDKNWERIKEQAWASVQEEWGGVTIDAHTGENVTGSPNKYALTVRPPGVYSVTLPVGSQREAFDAMMEDARKRFAAVLSNEHYHLGVFRDDAIDRIDIDPVLVLDDHDDVETIGAYTQAKGGAYNFSDGLGYWPPYVDKELDNAGPEGPAVQGAGRVVREGQAARGPP